MALFDGWRWIEFVIDDHRVREPSDLFVEVVVELPTESHSSLFMWLAAQLHREIAGENVTDKVTFCRIRLVPSEHTTYL